MSEKYTLNKEDGLKILKGSVIAAGGALITYLIDLLPNVDLGEYTAIVIPIASIVLNAILKFLQKK